MSVMFDDDFSSPVLPVKPSFPFFVVDNAQDGAAFWIMSAYAVHQTASVVAGSPQRAGGPLVVR